MNDDKEFSDAIRKRFSQLPKVVQDAILSADVEKQLRALSETHKLHLDQWESLENEVHYTLLGIQPAEDLAKNIRNETGVPQETAEDLAKEIAQIVFDPIRKELERQLEHPEAETRMRSGAEEVREQVLSAKTAPQPVPSTPPPPPVSQTVARAPTGEAYKPGETSGSRKEVRDDPYREAIT